MVVERALVIHSHSAAQPPFHTNVPTSSTAVERALVIHSHSTTQPPISATTPIPFPQCIVNDRAVVLHNGNSLSQRSRTDYNGSPLADDCTLANTIPIASCDISMDVDKVQKGTRIVILRILFLQLFVILEPTNMDNDMSEGRDNDDNMFEGGTYKGNLLAQRRDERSQDHSLPSQLECGQATDSVQSLPVPQVNASPNTKAKSPASSVTTEQVPASLADDIVTEEFSSQRQEAALKQLAAEILDSTIQKIQNTVRDSTSICDTLIPRLAASIDDSIQKAFNSQDSREGPELVTTTRDAAALCDQLIPRLIPIIEQTVRHALQNRLHAEKSPDDVEGECIEFASIASDNRVKSPRRKANDFKLNAIGKHFFHVGCL